MVPQIRATEIQYYSHYTVFASVYTTNSSIFETQAKFLITHNRHTSVIIYNQEKRM